MVIRITAPLLLATCLGVPALAQTSGLQQPAALIHGNYCGLGNNAPLPPVDALDAACARHDACTPVGGLPSRACNLRLQWETDRIARDLRQPDDIRALAGFIAAGAVLLPFDAHATIPTRAPSSTRFGPPAPPHRPRSYAY
ncbi:hypothetical protein [Methylobacterium sp.]|jgi:hypothetical protein|uniref:hypothetical protein n=1 Tax=Methylobacterium sp. TaxID=409 RepID=UPI0025DDA4D9|nr:hypothetical protein [Methylobacterium sp.]MBY0257043.1 hypothetical protein [Methylobacterium sp.]